ncbi:hypothetical protein PG989_016286 [Apiospora arundinis]
MCRVRVHCHQYGKCTLYERAPEPDIGDESGQEQAAAADAVQPDLDSARDGTNPSTGSRAPFFRMVNPFARRNDEHRVNEPVEMEPVPSPQAETPDAVVEGDKQAHIITETAIWQCADAQRNPALHEVPEKRVCHRPEPMMGYNPDENLDQTFTDSNEPCPISHPHLENAKNPTPTTRTSSHHENVVVAVVMESDQGKTLYGMGHQGSVQPLEDPTTMVAVEGQDAVLMVRRGPSSGNTDPMGDMNTAAMSLQW